MDKRELINENLVDILPIATTFILGAALGPSLKATIEPKLKRALEKVKGTKYLYASDTFDTTTNAELVRAHKTMYQKIANKIHNNKEIMEAIKRIQTGKGTDQDNQYMKHIAEEFNDLLSPEEQKYLLMIADPNPNKVLAFVGGKQGKIELMDRPTGEPSSSVSSDGFDVAGGELRKKLISNIRNKIHDQFPTAGKKIWKYLRSVEDLAMKVDTNNLKKINDVKIKNHDDVTTVINMLKEKAPQDRDSLLKDMGFDEQNIEHYKKTAFGFDDLERYTLISKMLDNLNMHPIDDELAAILSTNDTAWLRNLQPHTKAPSRILIDYVKSINNIYRKKIRESVSFINYSKLLEESLESAIQFASTNKIPNDVFDFFSTFDETQKKKLIHQMLVWYKANPKIYAKLQDGKNHDVFVAAMNAYCMFDRSGRIKIPNAETFAILKTNGFTIKTDPNFKPSPKDLDDDGNIKGFKGQYGILPQIEQFKTIEPFLEKISPLIKIETNSQLNKKAKENAKILADNDKYTIMMPTTDADFCKYGLNTKWCVSDKVGKYRRAYTFSHNIKLFYVLSKIFKDENSRFHKMCIAAFPPGHGYEDAFRAEGVKGVKNILVHWFDSKNNEGLPLPKSHPMTDEMVQEFINKHNMTDADLKKIGWVKFDYPFTLEAAIKLCADGPSNAVGDPIGVITISNDGVYSVRGSINLHEIRDPFRSEIRKTGKLPVEFGSVTKNFNAYGLGLKTLENSPKNVGGNFIVSDNDLTSLVGGPDIVGGSYDVSHNSKLSSKDGAPKNAKIISGGTLIRESIESLDEVNTKLTIKPNQNNILYDKKTITIIASENENNPELTKNTNWKIIPNELYFVIDDSAKFPSDAYHKLLYYPSIRIKKLYNAASQEVEFSEPKIKELFNKMEAPWNNPIYIQNVKY